MKVNNFNLKIKRNKNRLHFFPALFENSEFELMDNISMKDIIFIEGLAPAGWSEFSNALLI